MATFNLLDSLDKSDMIKDMVKYRDILLNDKDTIDLVKEIRNENDSITVIKKRKDLFKNENYKLYMKNYQELVMMVMEINKKYHEYTNTHNSCKES